MIKLLYQLIILIFVWTSVISATVLQLFRDAWQSTFCRPTLWRVQCSHGKPLQCIQDRTGGGRVVTGGGHNSAGGDMRTQCLHYHGYNLGRVQNVTPLLYIKSNYIWFKDSPMIGFWVHPSHKKITNFLTWIDSLS